jgi:hypothetical protein
VNPNQQYQIHADTHARNTDSVQLKTSKATDPAVEAKRARRWARATLVAHVVFTLSWVLAAAWQGPRYNIFSQSISDMYAEGAPGAWFLILVLTWAGITLVLFTRYALWPSLRTAGRPAAIGATLLALSIFGIGDVLTLFEREGCQLASAGCTSSKQLANSGGSLDAILSTAGVLFLVVAGFCLAAAFKRTGEDGDGQGVLRTWARPARRVSIAMIVLFVADGLTQSAGLSGLFERFIALLGAAGIIALAVGVLRVQRQRTTVPQPDALTE